MQKHPKQGTHSHRASVFERKELYIKIAMENHMYVTVQFSKIYQIAEAKPICKEYTKIITDEY